MHSTPQEAFAAAQASIARRDWRGFYACFDRGDLFRAAEEVIPVYVVVFGRDAWFVQHCAAHDVSLAALDVWEQTRRTMERAGMPAWRRSGGIAREQATTGLWLSERQRRLVQETQEAMREALALVADLDGFIAELVARVQGSGRAAGLPSTLFLGETLEQVIVDGDRARATRTVRGAPIAELEFVRRRGEWLVRLA